MYIMKMGWSLPFKNVQFPCFLQGVFFLRKSGIFLHITSLPGPYGVGTMGANAYAFVDFLQGAGQSFWQILPLTPTGYGDSPYQSCSAFAGNPYLIDFDLLCEEGLLKKEQVTARNWGDREDCVDFYALYQNKLDVLFLAFRSFSDNRALDSFCRENSHWLPEYALYMALKEERGGKPWYVWEEDIKFRQPEALRQARLRLEEKIRLQPNPVFPPFHSLDFPCVIFALYSPQC